MLKILMTFETHFYTFFMSVSLKVKRKKLRNPITPQQNHVSEHISLLPFRLLFSQLDVRFQRS